MTEQNEGLLLTPEQMLKIEARAAKTFRKTEEYKRLKRSQQKIDQITLRLLCRGLTYKLMCEAQQAKDKPIIEKQERERIIAWGVEPCPHWHMYPDVGVIKRDCSQCWQALKEKNCAIR